jgi:hypothetical protein
MRTFLLIFATVFFMASCVKEPGGPFSGNGTRDKGEYTFTIKGSAGGPHIIKGESVDTNWDPDLGLVYLGTDATHEPLGTLTITISKVENKQADILTGVVSKTDVRVGTGSEINGRTFSLIFPVGVGAATNKLDSVVVGSNFISAKFEMSMERELYWPEDKPETVTVSGHFTAVK